MPIVSEQPCNVLVNSNRCPSIMLGIQSAAQRKLDCFFPNDTELHLKVIPTFSLSFFLLQISLKLSGRQSSPCPRPWNETTPLSHLLSSVWRKWPKWHHGCFWSVLEKWRTPIIWLTLCLLQAQWTASLSNVSLDSDRGSVKSCIMMLEWRNGYLIYM